jgi:hypothetical protein
MSHHKNSSQLQRLNNPSNVFLALKIILEPVTPWSNERSCFARQSAEHFICMWLKSENTKRAKGSTKIRSPRARRLASRLKTLSSVEKKEPSCT